MGHSDVIFLPCPKRLLGVRWMHRAQFPTALHLRRLSTGEEEPTIGMAGHQGGVPICVPPPDAISYGTAGPLRVCPESSTGHIQPRHCCHQDRQGIPHTPHTTTARSQAGLPPQPNPLQCCDRRSSASSACQPGRVLYCQIQHQHLSVCGRRSRHCLQQDGDAEPTGSVCRVRDWSGFRFNAKKCGSMCMVNQAPRIYVDRLFTPHLGGDIIPALTWAERYRYLGCPTGAFRTRDQDLDSVKEDLLRDTSAIFKSPLTERQKLDVFRRFLFPRLTFIFQVIFPGPIWCRWLDTKLRGIIKQGLKLPQRTCSQYLLYLPQASGGLGVPNAEDEAYVAKAAQAFKFLGDTRDPVIRAVALQQLRATVTTRARSPTNS